jgi:hypothetical protein
MAGLNFRTPLQKWAALVRYVPLVDDFDFVTYVAIITRAKSEATIYSIV